MLFAKEYAIITLYKYVMSYYCMERGAGFAQAPLPKRADNTKKIARNIIMLKITVCIGSSCHIKGSRQVVEQLQELIEEHKLQDQVELCGTFCLGQCQSGVCVTVNDNFHSVSPETVSEFFANEVLAKV